MTLVRSCGGRAGEPESGLQVQACECLMDPLEMQEPFWKKEHRENGDHWVAARPADAGAQAQWAMAEDSNS